MGVIIVGTGVGAAPFVALDFFEPPLPLDLHFLGGCGGDTN